MIFASVPVIQAPSELTDTWPHWRGCHEELLIIDNTDNGDWADLSARNHWSYLHFGKNLGVPAAWNIARAKFLADTSRDHDLLFLFSSSVQWDDGLPQVLDDLTSAANWKGCQTQWGPHGIAWSRKVFADYGTLDENYGPGYFSDNDWFYRLILAGVLSTDDQAMPHIDAAGPVPIDGRAVRRTGLVTFSTPCHDYYVAKWGGPPSEEKFSTPFDRGLPTSWWTPAFRPGLTHLDPWVTKYRAV